MVAALQESLRLRVNVSEDSHYIGALGAALYALDHILAARHPVKNV
jgi:activator of 2-hydroxyglutaryl-CoA dehydratase